MYRRQLRRRLQGGAAARARLLLLAGEMQQRYSRDCRDTAEMKSGTAASAGRSQATIYTLQATSHNLHAASYKLQVARSELRAASPKILIGFLTERRQVRRRVGQQQDARQGRPLVSKRKSLRWLVRRGQVCWKGEASRLLTLPASRSRPVLGRPSRIAHIQF